MSPDDPRTDEELIAQISTNLTYECVAAIIRYVRDAPTAVCWGTVWRATSASQTRRALGCDSSRGECVVISGIQKQPSVHPRRDMR